MRIIIIGAGPGLSRGVAKLFGQKGFEVTLVSRNEEKLKVEIEELKVSDIKADYYVADAGDESSVTKMVDALQLLENLPDVIMYNAFAPVFKGIDDESWISLKQQLDVNVGGAFTILKEMLPEMQKQNKGKIFFTGGGFGIDPHPDFIGVSMGKAALRNLVIAAAKKLEGTNVHPATVTIYGSIGGEDPKYAPDAIAEIFWKLFQQPQGEFETEVVY